MSRNRSALTAFNRDVIRPGPQRGLRVVVPGGGSASLSPEGYLVTVDSGQTLFPALAPWPIIKGIQFGSGAVPIPAAAPTAGAAYTAGLSGGTLRLPNGGTTLVWLAYQSAYGSTNLGSVPKGTNVVCFTKLLLTYVGAVGGATTPIYVLGAL